MNELLESARLLVENNRRTYVAQAVADAKECPVCGEAVASDASRV